MFIADAHADSLMWNRDLNQEATEGHVDFPRLRRAGVGLQCFTVVTRGFPYVGGFPLFALSRGWPREARRGLWARAVFQFERLARDCEASGGRVRLTTCSDVLQRNAQDGTLSAVLGVEGAQALEGRVDRVAEAYRLGVRFMSLTHLSNNTLGGSSFPGMGNRPLTAFGRQVLDAMAECGMSVDVAHASRRTLSDILGHPRARPFCSHAGVEGAKALWRNLPDDALKTIADRGGIVGIIFAPPYLGGRTVDDVVRHIRHAVAMMGEDAVALGSDFDGMIPLPRGMNDVTDISQVARALDQAGFTSVQVAKIMGKNLLQFFGKSLAS